MAMNEMGTTDSVVKEVQEETKETGKKAAPRKTAAKKAESKTDESEKVKKAGKEEAPKAEAPKKTTAKKTAAKKAEAETVTTVSIQMEGKEDILVSQVLEAARKAFAETNPETEVKTFDVYIKPEEKTAYYAVNGEGSADYKIEL